MDFDFSNPFQCGGAHFKSPLLATFLPKVLLCYVMVVRDGEFCLLINVLVANRTYNASHPACSHRDIKGGNSQIVEL